MINTSTFKKDIILFIRETLKSGVTNPKGSSIPFIFTSYPEKNVSYPMITIKSTNMQTTALGMQSESVWLNMDIEVRVWALDEKTKDGLTQQVVDTLRKAKYGSGSTTENGIYGFQLTSANVVEEEGEGMPKSEVMTFLYSAILAD